MDATPPSPLRLRRLALGLRLRDVDLATGVRNAVLSGIERGRRPLPPRVLHVIAEFYNVPPGTLAAEYEVGLATHEVEAGRGGVKP